MITEIKIMIIMIIITPLSYRGADRIVENIRNTDIKMILYFLCAIINLFIYVSLLKYFKQIN